MAAKKPQRSRSPWAVERAKLIAQLTEANRDRDDAEVTVSSRGKEIETLKAQVDELERYRRNADRYTESYIRTIAAFEAAVPPDPFAALSTSELRLTANLLALAVSGGSKIFDVISTAASKRT